MVSSQVSGAGLEEVYEPKLFYFDSLRFIADSEIPRKGLESGQEDVITDKSQISDNSDKDTDSQDQTCHNQDNDAAIYDDQLSVRPTPSNSIIEMPTPGTGTTPRSSEMPRQKNERLSKRKRAFKEDDLLLLACEKLSSSSAENPKNDEYDSFGKTVAHDLRSMSRNQFIHAKKIISDVLYEGLLGNLSRSSSVSTTPLDNFSRAQSIANSPDRHNVAKSYICSQDDSHFACNIIPTTSNNVETIPYLDSVPEVYRSYHY